MVRDSVEIAPGLNVGKWMINNCLERANWLGEKYSGRVLYEPVNIVIIDEKSLTPGESERRLQRLCSIAGYPARFGHSDGYCGFINGEFRPQLPKQKMHCIANRMWCAPGIIEHGRIFGPAGFGAYYVYSAAFSSEGYSLRHPLSHPYVSMNRARDAFAAAMQKHGCLSAEKAELFNRLDEISCSTGDHDGFAIMLRILKK